VVKKREVHNFWTKLSNSEEPTWKCMHGKQCNHDDVSFMPSSLDQKRKNYLKTGVILKSRKKKMMKKY
jgi:hypothetical protein